jgi:hypothetical protein
MPFIKGNKHTEIAKLNISKAQKGRTHTEEARKKLSIALKGIKRSEETKKKMSLASRGRKWSNEHKIKMSNLLKGNKHWHWEGGITEINEKIRASYAYKEWRQNVFTRDEFTCQECAQIGGELEAHHRKAFSVLLQEAKKYLPLFDLYEAALSYDPLWNVDNGTTLCIKCHRKRKTI